MERLNGILEYLENALDVEHVEGVMRRLKGTVEYKETDRVPLKVGFPCETFDRFPYTETFNDMGKMMFNELLGVCNGAEIKDDSLPCIRSNYGVGTAPSLFGLNCRIVNENLPWVDHLESIDDIKRLIDKGIPDFKNGLGGKALETHEFYKEQLMKYPKCEKLIKIYHPDLQGPFDIAHLTWGGDIYYALYDEPELVHELLKLITATYVSFMKEIKKTIKDEDDSFCYHWGTLYKGKIVLRDDSPVNLSKDMYLEFIKPYDEMLFKEFGSGSMHYCGRADQWIFEMMDCKGLECLNFGRVPNLIYGDEFLNKIYGEVAKRKLAIVDYNIDIEDIGLFTEEKIRKGITFSTSVGSKKDALDIMNRR